MRKILPFLFGVLLVAGAALAQSVSSPPGVQGPTSAVSGHYATFNGTSGNIIQDGGGAPAASLVVGTTTITSGTNGRIEYNNAGVLGEMTTTGSGTTVALATGPTFSGTVTMPDASTWTSGGIAGLSVLNVGNTGVVNFGTRTQLSTFATNEFDIGFSGNKFQMSMPGNNWLQFGAADSASPAPQLISIQNVAAGSSNTSGVNATIDLSRGTGTGTGGNLVIVGSPHGTTGSTQNPLVTAATINGDTLAATFAGSVTVSGSAFTATGLVTLPDLATQATNTIVGNATSGTASPTALAIGSCSTSASALIWTTNSGFGCNTSIGAAAGSLTGSTLASGVTASSLTSVGTLTSLATSGAVTVTSASASSLAIGRLGATTPAFSVDSSTASQVAGVKVAGAATGGEVQISATDSGSNASIAISGKGTGTVSLGRSSTGHIQTVTELDVATGIQIQTITGSTQCLHVNTSGNVSGTGADCQIATSPTTQIFTSGSGTYTTPAGVKWIDVRMCGAGGGGGGGAAGGTGGSGSAATTFGTSLLTANVGTGGSAVNGNGGSGGTATGGDINITGQNGQGGTGNTFVMSGAQGGSTGLGLGMGGVGIPAGNGLVAAGFCSGGGGSAGTVTAAIGDGGGAGGSLEKVITAPLATYAYAIGSGGVGGTAGTSTFTGGAGTGGYIIVQEHYNY